MDDRVSGTPYELLDASHIVVKQGCVPTRIVLYRKGDEFVTHMQLLKTEASERGSCRFSHVGFEHGGYFTFKSESRPFISMTEQEALHNAVADFKERIRKL